jgi:glutaredoxin
MSAPNIVIFGAEWCAPCKTIKYLLDKQGVTYTYHDVDNDKTAADEMLAMTDGKYLLPTLKIGDQVMQNPAPHQVLQLVRES